MRERPLSMNVDGGSLTLGGAIDEGSVAALRTLLAGMSEAGESVVVDLTEVDYLPSFAIGVLAKARSRARGRGVRFDLVAPEGCTAHRVLQIAAIPYVERLEELDDETDAPDGQVDGQVDGIPAAGGGLEDCLDDRLGDRLDGEVNDRAVRPHVS